MAMAQDQPERTSDVVNNQIYYQLKWIPWGPGDDEFVPIVTQNENGPCPLIALANVLLLSHRIKIGGGETLVSSSHLMDLLGSCLLENPLADYHSANYQQNMQDAMAAFPRLQTGLDVNVKFNSVQSFEFTSESGIFDLFQVPLYHGWLVDPQDRHTYDVVCTLSYNQLVEMIINNQNSADPINIQNALICEEFLEINSSQLTHHGLCELNRVIKEGDMCVFFRNNHFNTIFKRQGQLLLLVTDSGFVNELGHVWKTVTDIDGSGDFLDAQFKYSTHSIPQGNREQLPIKKEIEEEQVLHLSEPAAVANDTRLGSSKDRNVKLSKTS
ncbi:ubiquitin carboxyl-terminal hydrolase MINDY-1-like isoform X2 [Halichondria panicea]|uniref:ubiquitin carboxyl-terminal hydrolase MINDY-1-like isoform X2 n=1 Tax=Halichondria panicea TaxID=6063 RepID=UPI00312B97E4